ncbi:MAG: bifunctional chorismate mutase/prephenate dehydrogenase [Desulfobacteraceae bacterium]|jgi:chorismate mutase/prephenate dehydrogenase
MPKHPPEPPAGRGPQPSCQGPSEATLSALRDQIDAIDRRIVGLLKDRQNVVEKVVALKKAAHLPVYHPAREENLISRLRAQAIAQGLDPDFVEELYRRIIRQSRVAQTAKLSRRGVRPGARVLVVGGAGSMGRYFMRWFGDAGYRVRSLERDDWAAAAERCREADLVLLCVPIDVTGAVARRLGPHLPPQCVLADITSLKAEPLQAMLAAHSGPVLGLHPLFGPTTSSMDKQIVVVTPGRMAGACQWVIDQFAAWGGILVQATPEEHDQIMGMVQALRHFATFTFGQFLCRKKADLNRSLEFSSPIYRLELGMVGRLFAQDAELYAEIIFATPQRRALLKDFILSLGSNLEMLEKGDKNKFCEEFRRVSEWFGPFGEQAIRESSYLIDKLIERF